MKINENTDIPLFAAIATIPFLVGGILWLSTIHAKANTANEKLDKVDQLLVDVAIIKTDLTYIKDHLDKTKEK